MKMFIGGVLILAFAGMKFARRGRPYANRSELRRAFHRQGTLHKGMRYLHYCDHCKPATQHGKYDLYLCDQERLPIAVARYGNEPREYVSSTDLSLPDEGIRITISSA